MKVLQLTPLAKARIWFGKATPGFASSGSMCNRADSDVSAKLQISRITMEALVARGARVQYGLLGLAFHGCPAATLEIDVKYSGGNDVTWSESLARQVDDVRLGLPLEYAAPVLVAASSFASHRFPPGRLETVEAAHGVVGSSAEVFRRLTLAILSLMLSGPKTDPEMKAMLRQMLVD